MYLVEYDTGTENFRQFREKLKGYAGLDFAYTLVIIADTQRRLEALKKAADALIDGEVLAQLITAFRCP